MLEFVLVLWKLDDTFKKEDISPLGYGRVHR